MKALFKYAAVLMILIPGLSCSSDSGAAVGQAPDFNVTDLAGNEVTMSDFRGKVLFVNFWATWCPPCRAEIPDFVDAYNAHKDEGLAILGLSLDEVTPEQLSAFLSDQSVTYPVAFATQQLINDFQPGQYIPSTIVIDKQGMIRERHVGMMDRARIEKLFQELSGR